MTGQEFSRRRKALGYTQDDMSRILDISKFTLCNQERSALVRLVYVYALNYLEMKQQKTIRDD